MANLRLCFFILTKNPLPHNGVSPNLVNLLQIVTSL
jgi:hypothetical protein